MDEEDSQLASRRGRQHRRRYRLRAPRRRSGFRKTQAIGEDRRRERHRHRYRLRALRRRSGFREVTATGAGLRGERQVGMQGLTSPQPLKGGGRKQLISDGTPTIMMARLPTGKSTIEEMSRHGGILKEQERGDSEEIGVLIEGNRSLVTTECGGRSTALMTRRSTLQGLQNKSVNGQKERLSRSKMRKVYGSRREEKKEKRGRVDEPRTGPIVSVTTEAIVHPIIQSLGPGASGHQARISHRLIRTT